MDDLYFIASKIAWFFLEPLHVLAIFILALALTRWMGSRITGVLSAVTLTCTLLLGTTPIWNSLLYEQETAHVPQTPERIEGIIILGGSINELVTEAHDQVSLNGAAERLTEALRLMRRYPEIPVVFSGFSGRFVRGALSESDVALRFFDEALGSTDRILLENQSRNTFENALYTKDLIGFAGNKPWLLVTSAFHMKRAHEIFKDRGINVVPYPVDFRSKVPSTEFRWNLSHGSDQLKILLHEWIGIWVYRLTQKP